MIAIKKSNFIDDTTSRKPATDRPTDRDERAHETRPQIGAKVNSWKEREIIVIFIILWLADDFFCAESAFFPPIPSEWNDMQH